MPTSEPLSWDKIAKLFDMIATVYRGDGLVDLPESGALPSPEIDAACDEYSRQLAVNLQDVKDPPDAIRGWMWARAVSVSAFAKQLSTQPEVAPEILDSKLVEQLLIDQWHGRLRALWPQLADWHGPDSSQL